MVTDTQSRAPKAPWSQPRWRRRAHALSWISGLLLFSACSREAGPPDVILITLDTTRADRIGCYGYEPASTPRLDAFAGGSTRFADASAHTASTLSSHATMLTGLTQLEHGVHRNAAYFLQDEFTTFTEVIAGQGYETGAVLSSFVLGARYGLDQGFAHYDRPETYRTGDVTTGLARDWIAAQSDTTRVFLWVHYWDPHDPYTPVEPFASTTRGTPYDAEISYMDHQVGWLLDALKANGRFENSHIIIVGDHGEGLGDHDEEFHSLLVYDSTIRVPFLWKTPGQTRGKVVDAPVGCADITPTLLDFLKLESELAFEGVSLEPTMKGSASPDREGLYVGSLVPFLALGWSPLHAWREPEWKYISCPEPELYDLTEDPGERTNRIGQEPEIAERMRVRLEEYLSVHDRSTPSARKVSNEERELMASLGYLVNKPREDVRVYTTLPDPKKYVRLETEFEELRDSRISQDWPLALAASETILSEHPDNRRANTGKAMAMLNLGRVEEARSWVQSHRELLTEDPDAWQVLGDASFELGRYHDAAEAYAKVPMHPLPTMDKLERRVAACLANGRFDEARALLGEIESKLRGLSGAKIAKLSETIDRVESEGLFPSRADQVPGRFAMLIEMQLFATADSLLHRWPEVLGKASEQRLRDGMEAQRVAREPGEPHRGRQRR